MRTDGVSTKPIADSGIGASRAEYFSADPPASTARGSPYASRARPPLRWPPRALPTAESLGREPAERLVVGDGQGEFDGRHDGRRRHMPERAGGQAGDVDEEGDAAKASRDSGEAFRSTLCGLSFPLSQE